MVLRGGEMPRKVIKAENTRQARAKARQQVGTLQSQVVQPQTLKRYHQAVHAFLDFLIAHQQAWAISFQAVKVIWLVVGDCIQPGLELNYP